MQQAEKNRFELERGPFSTFRRTQTDQSGELERGDAITVCGATPTA